MRTIARVKRAILALAATGTTIALVAGTVAAAHRRRCRFGSIFLPLLFLSVPVFAGGDGDRPTITFSELYQKGRPADFYSLGFSADDTVCTAALRLLNEPASIPPGLRMPYDYPKVLTAIFISTTANLPWEPQFVIGYNQSSKGRAGVLDAATGDVFNDGTSLQLYRYEGSVGGNRFHSLYAAPQPSLQDYLQQTDEHVDGGRVTKLLAPRSDLRKFELNLDDDRFIREAIHVKDAAWGGVFTDILRLYGRSYVLATSALGRYRNDQVFLIQFASYTDRQLLCVFRSNYHLE